MVEGWGQTESCGAGTIMPLERIKPGMIGTAAQFNEVSVAASGELLIAARTCSWATSTSPRRPLKP